MLKSDIVVTLIGVKFRCAASASTSVARRAANWLFDNVHSSAMILCRECHFAALPNYLAYIHVVLLE